MFWGLCALWLTLRFFTIFLLFFTIFLLFFTKFPDHALFPIFAHFFVHFSRSGNFFICFVIVLTLTMLFKK